MTTELTWFTFDVKVCSLAHVFLTSQPGNVDNYAYEFIIGAEMNTKTHLIKRNSGSILKTVETPAILDCSRNTTFWVSWTSGNIRLGLGVTIDGSTILEHTDTEYAVNSLSIASRDNSTAAWKFLRSHCEYS